jgi:hypothetical protein
VAALVESVALAFLDLLFVVAVVVVSGAWVARANTGKAVSANAATAIPARALEYCLIDFSFGFYDLNNSSRKWPKSI